MTSERHEERLGRRVRTAYEPFHLTEEQKRRHRDLLGGDATQRPERRQLAEVVALAAVAVLVIAGALIWQALPGRDSENAGVAPTSGSPTPTRAVTAIERERERAIPHAAPDTCPVSSWSGPEQRVTGDDAEWRHSYWVDGSGIALNSRLGVFFTGANEIRWFRSVTPLPQDTRYSVTQLSDGNDDAELSLDEPTYRAVGSDDPDSTFIVQPATIEFPESGCWRVQAEAEQVGFGLEAIVYVYPPDD